MKFFFMALLYLRKTLTDILPGAEDGTRTRYLQLGKLSLYQVSYFRLIKPGES